LCRVSEIQSNSNPADWYHCPTAENVADDLTKGITPKELNGRWFNGPSFLTLPEEQWPMEMGIPDAQEVNKERRKVTVTCPVTVAHPIFDCQRYAKWKRIVRVTAYIQRFGRNLHAKRNDENTQPELGPLTGEELQAAEEYWLKQAQSSLFQRMKKGDFKTLSPYVDKKKLIRVGGRVDPSLVSYDNERLVLLPYNSHISKVIIRDAHQVGHNGVAATVAKTRNCKGHQESLHSLPRNRSERRNVVDGEFAQVSSTATHATIPLLVIGLFRPIESESRSKQDM
jgi:hypothetical protein